MPFYEYQCRQCEAQTEVMQKISDRPLKKCPECGKNALVRLISAPVFRLKGGGWYETDFKTDQDRKRNLVDSGGDSGDKDSAAKGQEDKAASPKTEETKAAGTAGDGGAKAAPPANTKEKSNAGNAKDSRRKSEAPKSTARTGVSRAKTSQSARKGARGSRTA